MTSRPKTNDYLFNELLRHGWPALSKNRWAPGWHASIEMNICDTQGRGLRVGVDEMTHRGALISLLKEVVIVANKPRVGCPVITSGLKTDGEKDEKR